MPTTDQAVHELVALAWHQFGGVGPVPAKVLRGKYDEEILDSSSGNDDSCGDREGGRGDVEERCS